MYIVDRHRPGMTPGYSSQVVIHRELTEVH